MILSYIALVWTKSREAAKMPENTGICVKRGFREAEKIHIPNHVSQIINCGGGRPGDAGVRPAARH